MQVCEACKYGYGGHASRTGVAEKCVAVARGISESGREGKEWTVYDVLVGEAWS